MPQLVSIPPLLFELEVPSRVTVVMMIGEVVMLLCSLLLLLFPPLLHSAFMLSSGVDDEG